MAEVSPIQFEHPANQGILAFIRDMKSLYPNAPQEQSVAEADLYQIHTHPDLIEYFWGGRQKPWIFLSRPILVHPVSGIIYAMATGTDTIALRLPQEEREIAFLDTQYGQQSAGFMAASIGAEWAFIRPYQKGVETFFESAFKFAAE
jgi:hypothetical protein